MRRRPICVINAEDNSLEAGLKTPPARGHSEKDPTRARLVVVETKGLFSVDSTCVKGENLATVSLLGWPLIAISSQFVVVFQTI